jgi:hypothetical protein
MRDNNSAIADHMLDQSRTDLGGRVLAKALSFQLTQEKYKRLVEVQDFG